jgi:methionine-rich copper-binding protein CopC
MRAYAIPLLAAASLLAGPAARAHSFLEQAKPSVGSTVQRPPSNVSLRFSAALEPAFTTIEVVDAAGQRVDQGDARVDAAEATVVRASLKPLPPGTYKVKWRVLSTDSHPTEGDFTFRVAGN